jgi:Protein of unknown function DUF2834
MNPKQIVLSLVLMDFLGLTGYAAYHYGFAGFYQAILANAATVTIFCDLVIALSMVLTWIVRDARRRGVSPLLYVVLTLALGSVGPLIYLIGRRETEPAVGPRRVASPAGA